MEVMHTNYIEMMIILNGFRFSLVMFMFIEMRMFMLK